MTRRAGLGLAVGLVLLGLVGLAAPGAQAKSFEIRRFSVEATLEPDGTMHVAEHITYRFDGSFTVGTRSIPPGDWYEVVDVEVTEHGEPLPLLIADPASLEWSFRATDETRTFTVSYRVLGAARVGPDVGELHWQWVGTDHPGIRQLDVTLTVPGDGEGVRAWAHGPRHGVVRPEGRVVTFDVAPVPARTFVEGRVAVPAGAFTVAPAGGERLPAILAEEQRLADAANRQRRQTRVLSVVAVLAGIAGVAGFVALWRRWGKEPPAPADVGEYWRDPIDDPPAVAVGLLGFGKVPPLAFAATLVDLAQRGHLVITEERSPRLLRSDKVEWRFSRARSEDRRPGTAPDPLLPYEQRALTQLFAAGDPVSQSEFVAWGNRNAKRAQAFWREFQRSVTREVKARRYLEHRGAHIALNGGLAAGLVLAGIVLLGREVLAGAVPLLAGAGQAAASPLLRQRTPAGARRAAQWEAMRRFLRDFSTLDDAPIGHLVLYERYLVYAVALGVADELTRGLALRVPAVTDPASGFAPWYRAPAPAPAGIGGGMPRTMAGFGSIGSIAISFAAETRAAFAPKSSGSGGGGGFSGGGGGGGGGGGMGAR